MIFGEFQKSSAAAHRRRSMATTSAITDYEADLTSRDRLRQKEAIKRTLAGKVKNDWAWTWPRDENTNQPGTPIVNRSREDLASEEAWTERLEWASNASDSDVDAANNEKPAVVAAVVAAASPTSPADDLSLSLSLSSPKSPFRFNSADGVAEVLQQKAVARRVRRRRRLAEEMRTNDGLRCFTHRRNAWTCARHVRRRGPETPTTSTMAPLRQPVAESPLSATNNTRPSSSSSSGSSFSVSSFDSFASITTQIPIAPPILPPETPMRKGISEKAHATIYDKVVVQSQTPFCPINLSVVVKSCVEGWKRDGEWGGPAHSGVLIAAGATLNRSLVDRGVLAQAVREGKSVKAGTTEGQQVAKNREKDKDKGVFRRSLQKVMGIGGLRERAGSKGGKEDEGGGGGGGEGAGLGIMVKETQC